MLTLVSSVYALRVRRACRICQELVKRCHTASSIRWGLSSIYDAIKTWLLTAPEVALRQLNGRGLPGGKGLLDVLMAKKDAAEALSKMADEHGMHFMLRNKFEKWAHSVMNYRDDVGYLRQRKENLHR